MMDDRRTEDILRESWQPEPPAGMRERVFGRAREQAGQRREWSMPRWQVACALAGVLIFTVSTVCDWSLRQKLAVLANHPQCHGASLVASKPITIAQWRVELDRQMGYTPGAQR